MMSNSNGKWVKWAHHGSCHVVRQSLLIFNLNGWFFVSLPLFFHHFNVFHFCMCSRFSDSGASHCYHGWIKWTWRLNIRLSCLNGMHTFLMAIYEFNHNKHVLSLRISKAKKKIMPLKRMFAGINATIAVWKLGDMFN